MYWYWIHFYSVEQEEEEKIQTQLVTSRSGGGMKRRSLE